MLKTKQTKNKPVKFMNQLDRNSLREDDLFKSTLSAQSIREALQTT